MVFKLILWLVVLDSVGFMDDQFSEYKVKHNVCIGTFRVLLVIHNLMPSKAICSNHFPNAF